MLGLPLIGSNLAQFAIGLTDAIMLGWYDVTALAAVTLAGGFYFVLFVLGGGFAFAVMPMVAAAIEEGDKIQVRRLTRMGMWASTLYGVLFMIPLIWSEPLFLAMGQDPKVASLGQTYLRIAGWQLALGLIVLVMRSFLAALERTQVILWVTVGTAVLNVFLNYALIFGNWGAPELGLQGAAIASVSLVVLSVIALFFYIGYVTPEYELFVRLWRVDTEALMRVVKVGVPIGLTVLAEVGLFSASSVMMGWLGTLELAAHGVALQLATAVFVVHLGLSQAATVRAGQALGRHDEPALRRTAWTSMTMSAVFGLLGIAAFVLFPEPLVSLFIDPMEPAKDQIVALGITLLIVAGIFQTVDAAQVVMMGLLRGIQDTRIPMLMAVFSYWGVGIFASYVLGFVLGYGGVGIWCGLVVGLASAAILLSWRFWSHTVKIGG